MWRSFWNTQPDPALDKLRMFTHIMDVAPLNAATDKLVELGYSMEASSSSMRAAASMISFVHADQPAFVLDDSSFIEITGPAAASTAAPHTPRGFKSTAAAAAPAPTVGRAPDHCHRLL